MPLTNFSKNRTLMSFGCKLRMFDGNPPKLSTREKNLMKEKKSTLLPNARETLSNGTDLVGWLWSYSLFHDSNTIDYSRIGQSPCWRPFHRPMLALIAFRARGTLLILSPYIFPDKAFKL